MHDTDFSLNQLLADPLVRLMMSSDGVEETYIRQLAERIAPKPHRGSEGDEPTGRERRSHASARPFVPIGPPARVRGSAVGLRRHGVGQDPSSA